MRRGGTGRNLRSAAILLGTLLLWGCAREAEAVPDDQAQYQVYYISKDETEIVASPYHLSREGEGAEEIVAELIDALQTVPEMLEYELPISGDAALIDHTLTGNVLTLNFAETYANLPPTTEILIRAAIVRTFTQVEGIDNVSFQIAGNPLTDARGEVIGNMTADLFIYNAGREINTYEKARLTLYFANETGRKLVPVYRTVVYNSNILMERVIVEQILLGPNLAGSDPVLLPTINPACGIINISLRDGICYVNLDENFLIETNAVSAEAAIYSIVNSLAELPEVSRVQISVQGDTSASFLDVMPLSTMYTRNLDIIETN